ncbi:hypothetical protein [Cardinium endosymbiont of Sogatella furcifera]|uniref:hypothetical protein n=1 Tax=Cardinium endosymbiont of Sogatella furcifera TaxID=650378 RepID=UPI000E0CEA6E|nr:hypothetical protein [Cardinium endosymbiont of Sogatella furcifera]
MKRLYSLLLLSTLTGCSQVKTIGMDAAADLSMGNPTFLTTLNGDLVSFAQKNNNWTAMVSSSLPEDCATFPVYFEQGWSIKKLSTYSRDQQKKLIHIERIPKIGAIVYVGRVGLPGGGGQEQVVKDTSE